MPTLNQVAIRRIFRHFDDFLSMQMNFPQSQDRAFHWRLCGRLFVYTFSALMANSYCSTSDATTLACSLEETATFAQAPRGALRAATHTLRVNFKGGYKTFVDRAPYEENDMDGLVWRYCGYDAAAGIHLIEKEDDGHSGGVILREDNGQVALAGFRMHVSPDKRNFLSEEQEDGMYGELWTWRGASGQMIWRGAAIIKQGERIAALLDDPAWSDQNELIAHFVCDGLVADESAKMDPTPNQQAKLIRNGERWEWQADNLIVCQIPE